MHDFGVREPHGAARRTAHANPRHVRRVLAEVDDVARLAELVDGDRLDRFDLAERRGARRQAAQLAAGAHQLDRVLPAGVVKLRAVPAALGTAGVVVFAAVDVVVGDRARRARARLRRSRSFRASRRRIRSSIWAIARSGPNVP